jgi:dTDP-4-amino-4,6-dideoxygalactose transaminase
MMWPQWQPPAFSPLSRRALARGLAAELSRDDPRPVLSAVLRHSYDAQLAHLTASGTTALEVAIRLARVRAGPGPVALPAYGCYELATAAVGAGEHIALYDVDPTTLGPDLESLTSVLAAGARTVVIAPILGIPVDWEAVSECAASFGAVLIEDAAQGHGAFWRGRPLGSLGPITVLSFGRGKGWTGGRGGAVLIRDPLLAEFSRGLSLRDPRALEEMEVLAMATAQATFAHPARFGIPAHVPWLHLGETHYHDPRPMSGVSRATAALLLATCAAAGTEARRRGDNARAFLELLSERACDVLPIPIARDAVPGYLRLPVRIPAARGGRARVAGTSRYGVATGYPSTLAALACVRGRLHVRGAWPGAGTLVRELITLPTHGWTSESDRRAIVELIGSSRELLTGDTLEMQAVV